MTQPLPPDLAEVERANYAEAMQDHRPIVEPVDQDDAAPRKTKSAKVSE